jgi:hypothetical protein
MPKRKRAEPAGSASPDPAAAAARSLARRKAQCTQRIAAAQKSLVAALRIAAGLERQKHSRRKKTAQSNKDAKGLARIEAEYAHLKGLDLEKVAAQHLHKTFARVKTLRESECMPQSVEQAEKGAVDPASLNVKGRLFKVDAVRKVVDEAVDELKEIVGGAASHARPEGKRGAQSKKARRQEGAEEAGAEADVDGLAQHGGEDSDAFAAFDTLIAAPSSAEDDSEDSLSDGHRPLSEEDLASGGEDEDDDTDDDEQQDTTSSAESVDGDDRGPALDTFSNDEEDSASASDDLSIPLPKTRRTAAESKATADSKFLPTLSHPTYLSGSESDASDLEVAPRKNRRGQKARQKIWEAKYKEQAKHVLKQDRDSGWDAKRGAVSARGGRRELPRGRGPAISGANELPLGPKKSAKPKRDDVGILHPSWLAAKAAKEKKMDMKPMGKKVVFD